MQTKRSSGDQNSTGEILALDSSIKENSDPHAECKPLRLRFVSDEICPDDLLIPYWPRGEKDGVLLHKSAVSKKGKYTSASALLGIYHFPCHKGGFPSSQFDPGTVCRSNFAVEINAIFREYCWRCHSWYLLDAGVGLLKLVSALTGFIRCFVECQVLLIFRLHMGAILSCSVSLGWEREYEWGAAARSRVPRWLFCCSLGSGSRG